VAGDPAAIDVQDLPGDMGRCLQEQHAVHNVADLAADRVEPPSAS